MPAYGSAVPARSDPRDGLRCASRCRLRTASTFSGCTTAGSCQWLAKLWWWRYRWLGCCGSKSVPGMMLLLWLLAALRSTLARGAEPEAEAPRVGDTSGVVA